MKWFQVDSDTPNDPKVKAIIRKGLDPPDKGQAAAGALLLLWCYVADHGGGQPGEGVDGDGMPLPLAEMADECLFPTVEDLTTFLTFLADKHHIDPDRWTGGVVFLPAMMKRADGYAKSKGRGEKLPRPGENQPLQHKTRHDTTPQTDQTGGTALPGFEPPTAEDLVALWNRCRTKGPGVRGLDDKRRRAIGDALKAEPDLATWQRVISWCDVQKGMNAPGTGKYPNWRMDIDFLVKKGQLLRLQERMSADGPHGGGGGRVQPTPGKFAAAAQDDDASQG